MITFLIDIFARLLSLFFKFLQFNCLSLSLKRNHNLSLFLYWMSFSVSCDLSAAPATGQRKERRNLASIQRGTGTSTKMVPSKNEYIYRNCRSRDKRPQTNNRNRVSQYVNPEQGRYWLGVSASPGCVEVPGPFWSRCRCRAEKMPSFFFFSY